MFLEEITNLYQPLLAIVIHKKQNDSGKIQAPDSPSFYLESHDFVPANQPGMLQLGAGRPLKSKTLDELAGFFKKRKQKEEKVFTFKGLIPANMLKVHQQGKSKSVTWYLRSPRRKLYFAKALNIPNGEVILPNLLFHYSGGVKVYAFVDDELTGKTQLYHAPFHNTSSEGVCMGSAQVKIKTHFWEDLIISVENAFFNSYFTHLNGNNPIKGNLNLVYDRCIAEKKPFPLEVLRPISKSLHDIVKAQ